MIMNEFGIAYIAPDGVGHDHYLFDEEELKP